MDEETALGRHERERDRPAGDRDAGRDGGKKEELGGVHLPLEGHHPPPAATAG